MVEISHQPATVQLGLDMESASLLFAGEQLLAVLVYLDPDQYRNDVEISGKWSVEIGFGACEVGTKTVLFPDLEAAAAWAADRLASLERKA